MNKDRIVILDRSPLLNNFMAEMLEQYDFEVVAAKSPLDALIKMKNILPELVILDYLSIEDKETNVLVEKEGYKSIADIPVILLASDIDMEVIMEAGKYKVFKILPKPIKVDVMLKTISEAIGKRITIDTTASILDVHCNLDIIFIEVGMGLNKEKIHLLKYKILELKNLYGISKARVILMFLNVKIQASDIPKLYTLIDNILAASESGPDNLKVLTADNTIIKNLGLNKNYDRIEVVPDIEKAMESFGNIDVSDIISENRDLETGDLNIHSEQDKIVFSITKKLQIAIVDDDEVILEFIKKTMEPLDAELLTYKNGKELVDALPSIKPDLIFLDLMMPVMSGFEVLANFKENSIQVPVIIFTAYAQKEAVEKAIMHGVKSFIVKPIDPRLILKKTKEILRSNF
jgi:CheY-like chemotaxis protein